MLRLIVAAACVGLVSGEAVLLDEKTFEAQVGCLSKIAFEVCSCKAALGLREWKEFVRQVLRSVVRALQGHEARLGLPRQGVCGPSDRAHRGRELRRHESSLYRVRRYGFPHGQVLGRRWRQGRCQVA